MAPATWASAIGSASLEHLLSRSLAEADPELRSQLLLDLLEFCLRQRCPRDGATLQRDAETAVTAIQAPDRRLEQWLRLALLLQRHGEPDRARQALQQANQSLRAVPTARREALLLRLGLAYAELGDQERAEQVFAEGEQLMQLAEARKTAFPFPEQKLEGKVGLAVSAATYDDTTISAVANFDLYKQWPRDDFEANLFASINYDSSRDFNLTWPVSQGFLAYRHRLDRRQFLFVDQLVAVNDSTFSTQNDDDDISVLSGTLLGYGYTIWQGPEPGSFQAVQLGIGPRYEYAEIDLNRRRDQVDTTVALVYRSREVPIGAAKWSQVFAVATPVDTFDEAFFWSSTRLDWPITKRWMWTNRLSVRYRSRPLEPGFERLNVILSTGLTYSF
ncbi:tetratricopeptide repeat protein [Cyanobium sp. NIES-981]|uniref:tetratricopeptide repeat protein n=1 Tax=Cyanobium sp. NIES-981 TaxID=1851505 RepID=UPI0012F88F56|nr:tetratricopeptide repeat protein [Cyanobium sp. NIES-981]